MNVEEPTQIDTVMYVFVFVQLTMMLPASERKLGGTVVGPARKETTMKRDGNGHTHDVTQRQG